MEQDRQEIFEVTEELSGKRADIVLSHFLSEHTRSQIKKLIDDQNVLVKGKPIKPSKKFDQGEIVHVTLPAPVSIDAEPENIALNIIYEDSSIVVVNKPAGMVVHPGAGVKSGTLVNALLFKCDDLSGIGGKIRPGIVHRLDKDTSGVIVVAKNDHSHHSLVDQFKSRTIKKRYLAIVEGNLKSDSGSFDSAIGRDPIHRIKMSSKSKTGRASLTFWNVLNRFESVCLVEAEPKTGRTHQIRVHFSENGYPILADKVYGHKRQKNIILSTAEKMIGRHALHASKIGFTHPANDKWVEFTAPIPEDMKQALDYFENINGDD
ncbi:MAG: RluA family pseudouridine synthase [Thermodesulfobacteriota bacterium]